MMKHNSGSPEDGISFLKEVCSNSKFNCPLTLECLYSILMVLINKLEDQDLTTISSFLYFGLLDEIANIHSEYRKVMINFKVHKVCIQ